MPEATHRIEPFGEKCLTISELNLLLGACLEREFPRLVFEGEISQFSAPISGHIYYSVKDSDSQATCVMWRASAQKLSFKPCTGMKVVCYGKPNVYRQSGKLQILVDRMVEAGEGLLQKRFLELKAKLEKEGLFSKERKRKLPFLPRAIGVVTSQSGAVIKDIMVKIQERMPQIQVYLASCRVQGEGSAEEIASAIELLNQLAQSGQLALDVIIVARGGGSLEDLWSFNEERVVRAIFASALPVVSGVGHETDLTLSDFVADLRAPTPTAAAEMVVPKRSELIARVLELETRLSKYERWLGPLMQRVDENSARLERSIQSVIKGAQLSVRELQAKHSKLEPAQYIALLRARLLTTLEQLSSRLRANQLCASERVAQLNARLSVAADKILKHRSHQFEQLTTKLEALSPKQVLARGYSVIEQNGQVVSSTVQLALHSEVRLVFYKGEALADIKKVI